MSGETVGTLNTAIQEIIQEPATREKLQKLGFELTGSTPGELKAYLLSETRKWADIIKSEGLAPEQN